MSVEENIARKLRESRKLKEKNRIDEGRYTGTTTVRRTAEEVLKDHGLNNSVGQYDKFVNKMWGLYKETLLDVDKLKAVMEREFQKMYPNLKESESVGDEESIPADDEELDEDWRDGKFSDGDLKLYCAKMVKEAERLAFSINMMAKEHPEYASEFNGLKGRIIKRFQ